MIQIHLRTFVCTLLIVGYSLQLFSQDAFSPTQVISTEAEGAQDVFAIDLDDDGDIDVLSASWVDGKIAWYENLGNGSFDSAKIISSDIDGAYDLRAADLDGNGDNDVVCAGIFSNTLNWFRNNGNGSFSGAIALGSFVQSVRAVHATDIDGDSTRESFHL